MALYIVITDGGSHKVRKRSIAAKVEGIQKTGGRDPGAPPVSWLLWTAIPLAGEDSALMDP